MPTIQSRKIIPNPDRKLEKKRWQAGKFQEAIKTLNLLEASIDMFNNDPNRIETANFLTDIAESPPPSKLLESPIAEENPSPFPEARRKSKPIQLKKRSS